MGITLNLTLHNTNGAQHVLLINKKRKSDLENLLQSINVARKSNTRKTNLGKKEDSEIVFITEYSLK